MKRNWRFKLWAMMLADMAPLIIATLLIFAVGTGVGFLIFNSKSEVTVEARSKTPPKGLTPVAGPERNSLPDADSETPAMAGAENQQLPDGDAEQIAIDETNPVAVPPSEEKDPVYVQSVTPTVPIEKQPGEVAFEINPEEESIENTLKSARWLAEDGRFARALDYIASFQSADEELASRLAAEKRAILKLWVDSKTPPEIDDKELLVDLARDGFEQALALMKKAAVIESAEDTIWLEALAGSDDLSAMVELAHRLTATGQSTEALPWYRRAADLGSADAAYRFGECRLMGKGISPDLDEGIAYLNQSANAGDNRAMDLLGVCHVRGLGVEVDFKQAIKWFEKAIQAGNVAAYYNLGARLAQGQGAEKDPVRAAELFKAGAEKGNAICMLTFAKCLETGFGVTANMDEARTWYQLAAKAGNQEAQAWCDSQGILTATINDPRS